LIGVFATIAQGVPVFIRQARPTPKSKVSQIAEESDGAVQTTYSGVGSRFLLTA
jgi:hypothetical protein